MWSWFRLRTEGVLDGFGTSSSLDKKGFSTAVVCFSTKDIWTFLPPFFNRSFSGERGGATESLCGSDLADLLRVLRVVTGEIWPPPRASVGRHAQIQVSKKGWQEMARGLRETR